MWSRLAMDRRSKDFDRFTTPKTHQCQPFRPSIELLEARLPPGETMFAGLLAHELVAATERAAGLVPAVCVAARWEPAPPLANAWFLAGEQGLTLLPEPAERVTASESPPLFAVRFTFSPRQRAGHPPREGEHMADRRERELREEAREKANYWAKERKQAEQRKAEAFLSKFGSLTQGVAEDDPRLTQRAYPSDYGWKGLDQWIESGEREIYLIGRASTRGQKLKHVMLGAHRYAVNKGVRVVYLFREERGTTGKSVKLEIRPQLHRALQKARQRGLPLIFVSPSRALRTTDYHPVTNPNAMPNVAEFDTFMDLAKGVKLGTLNPPDSTPTEDEVFIRDVLVPLVTRRKPGPAPTRRPGECKELKAKWFGRANRLKRKGWSYERIASHIYVKEGKRLSPSAVRKWCIEGGTS